MHKVLKIERICKDSYMMAKTVYCTGIKNQILRTREVWFHKQYMQERKAKTKCRGIHLYSFAFPQQRVVLILFPTHVDFLNVFVDKILQKFKWTCGQHCQFMTAGYFNIKPQQGYIKTNF